MTDGSRFSTKKNKYVLFAIGCNLSLIVRNRTIAYLTSEALIIGQQ